MPLLARVSSRRRETASRSLRAAVAVALVAGGVSVMASVAAPAVAAAATTFSDPSVTGTYTVPDGVTTIRIAATGGAGGSGSLARISDRGQIVVQGGGLGKPGTAVTMELAVTPGQQLSVNVGGGGRSSTGTGGFGSNFGAAGGAGAFGGGAGGDGTNSVLAGGGGGGGGGGASFVTSGNQRLVVAGGGGGGGGGGVANSGVLGEGHSFQLLGGDGGVGGSAPGSGEGTVYDFNGNTVERFSSGGTGGAAASNSGGGGGKADHGGGGGGGGGGVSTCAVVTLAGGGAGGGGGVYSSDRKAYAAGGGGGAGGSCAAPSASNVTYATAPTATGGGGSVVISVPQATTTSVGLADGATLVPQGADGTFLATVTPNDGVGTVDFVLVRSNGVESALCTGVPVDATGRARCTAGRDWFQSAGVFGVRAAFRGTATAQSSTSGNVTFSVGPPTPVTMDPVPATVDQNQLVTFRAGTAGPYAQFRFTFSDGRTFDRSWDNGSASVVTSFTRPGPVTVTATYLGQTTGGRVYGPGSVSVTLTVTTILAVNRVVLTPSTPDPTTDPGGTVTYALSAVDVGQTQAGILLTPAQYSFSVSPEGSCSAGNPASRFGDIPVTCTGLQPGPHAVTARENAPPPPPNCYNCTTRAPAVAGFQVRGPAAQLGGLTAQRVTNDPRITGDVIVANQPFRVSARLQDAWGSDLGPFGGRLSATIAAGGDCVADLCWSNAPGPVTVTVSVGNLRGSGTVMTLPQIGSTGASLQLVPSGPVYVGRPVTWRIAATDGNGNPAPYQPYSAQYILDGNPGYVFGPGTDGADSTVAVSCTGFECTLTLSQPGRHVLTVLASGAVGSAPGADQGAASIAFDVVKPPVATAVDPSPAFTSPDQPVPFTVRSIDADGNTVADVTEGATFAFADGRGQCFGRVCVSSAFGDHPIVVTPADPGLPPTVAHLVVAGPVVEVDVDASSQRVSAGDDIAFTALTLRAFADQPIDATGQATWTLRDQDTGEVVACDGKTGPCTPRRAGVYALTATVDGVDSWPLVFQVVPGNPASLSVDLPDRAVAGEAVTGAAWVADAFGNRLYPTGVFTRADSATCTEAPQCTFTRAGQQLVVFVSFYGQAQAVITVLPATPVQGRVVIDPAPVPPGEPVPYRIDGVDAFGNAVTGANGTVAVTSDSDATCDADDCASTVAGEHVVTAHFGDGDVTTSFFVTPAEASTLEFTGPMTAVAGAVDLGLRWRDRFGNVADAPPGSGRVLVGDPAQPLDCTSACTVTTPGQYAVEGDWLDTDGVTLRGVVKDVLTVSAGPASTFALDGEATWAAGSTNTVTVSAADAAGNPVPVPTDAGLVLGVAPDGRCDAGGCTVTRTGPHRVSLYRGDQEVAGLDVSVDPGSMTALSVSVPDTIVAGSALEPVVAGTDAYGNDVGSVNPSLSVSPDGSCDSNSCLLTRAGVHTVTATAGDRTASATVTVLPDTDGGRRTTVDAPDTWTAGRPVTVTPVVTDPFGNALDLPTDATVTVAPDGQCDGTVCTVSAAGPHRVRVMVGDAEVAGRDVTVVAGAPAALRLSAAQTVTAGQTFTVGATATDAQGNDLGGRTPTLTISPDGSCDATSCTATVAGPHTVTAGSDDLTGSVTVTVQPDAGRRVTLDAPDSWTAGDAVTVGSAATDSYGNAVPTPSDARVVIGPDGSCDGTSCTATVAGAHRVSVMQGDTELGGRDVTVTPGPLAALHLAVPSTTAAGAGFAVTAGGTDAYGNDRGAVVPSLSITPDGSCDATSCTATVAGPHTVTATSGAVTGSATVTVTPAAVVRIALSAPAVWTAGDTVPVGVSGVDRFGNVVPAVPGASVVARGKVCVDMQCRVLASGSMTVVADAAGLRIGKKVTVRAGAAAGLVVTPSATSVVAGGSVTLSTRGRDAFGNDTGAVTARYRADGGSVCTGTTCVLTRAGTRTVTAAAAGLTGRASVTVTAGAAAKLRLTLDAAQVPAGGVVTAGVWTTDALGNVVTEVTDRAVITVGTRRCEAARCTVGASDTRIAAAFGGWRASLPVKVTAAGG